MPIRMFALGLLSADSSIARFDKHSLPEQLQMELAVENLTEDAKENFCGGDCASIEVCSWEAVKCDVNGHVALIDFGFHMPCGTLDLACMPDSTTSIALNWVNVHGTFVAASLLRCLHQLTVLGTELTGTIDAGALPAALTYLELSQNELAGSLGFAALPEGLRTLSLVTSKLCGGVALTALPPALQFIDLSTNAFSGKMDLSSLPAQLQQLFAAGNRFVGEIQLDNLPIGLTTLVLSRNELCGDLLLYNLPPSLSKLMLDRNAFGSRFELLCAPAALEKLDISGNALHGTVVVSRAGNIIENVLLCRNEITEAVDERGVRYTCRRTANGFVQSITVAGD